MRRIQRMVLPLGAEGSAQLPRGAIIINVERDSENFAVWFEADDASPRVWHRYAFLGEGDAVPPELVYASCVSLGGAKAMRHLYFQRVWAGEGAASPFQRAAYQGERRGGDDE